MDTETLCRFAQYKHTNVNADTSPPDTDPMRGVKRVQSADHIEIFNYHLQPSSYSVQHYPSSRAESLPKRKLLHTPEPERTLMACDISEGHQFPPPEQVEACDSIFKVVQAEVHATTDQRDDVNGDRAKIWIGSEAPGDKNESTSSDDSSIETYTTSTNSDSDDDGSFGETNQEESVNGDKKSGSSDSAEVINSDDAHEESAPANKTPRQLKVVGFFDGPGFATMKHTTAGKVWLWDRPEDLLVIKDDGRVIDPSSERKRSPKSYHRQVKSSMGKLYEHFFSKNKTNNQGTKGDWGTTNSLDRRAVANGSQRNRDLHISLSSYDILNSSDEK